MFDVYIIERDSLMVCRPKGVIDFATAVQLVEFIEIKETASENGFDRFTDLTHFDSINLSAEDVSKLADRRRAFNPNNFQVRSAFLATHPLALGVARMYEKLLNSPRIEVRVYDNLEAVAEWLVVKTDRLKL